jgi:hypothetical protein
MAIIAVKLGSWEGISIIGVTFDEGVEISKANG